MIRARFGIKAVLPFGLFPNACIFVVKMESAEFEKMFDAFAMIRFVLSFVKRDDIAQRIICEPS